MSIADYNKEEIQKAANETKSEISENKCSHTCLYVLSQNLPSKKDFEVELKKYKAPGTCIFFDMSESTKLKQSELSEWIWKMANTFVTAITGQPFNFSIDNHIVKVLGDGLMMYIPEQCLNKSQEDYYGIFDFVRSVVSPFQNKIKDITVQWKASINYCDDVFNISFFKDQNDYYGNGIDLTSRLLQKAKKYEIILGENFFRKVENIFVQEGIIFKDECSKFKGFDDCVNYKICNVECFNCDEFKQINP